MCTVQYEVHCGFFLLNAMTCKLPSLSLLSVLTYGRQDWFLALKLSIIELSLNMKIIQLHFTQIIFIPNLTILKGNSAGNYKSKIFFQIRTFLTFVINYQHFFRTHVKFQDFSEPDFSVRTFQDQWKP